MNGDVMMLKRLFQYQAHNKLLPALQVGEAADIIAVEVVAAGYAQQQRALDREGGLLLLPVRML